MNWNGLSKRLVVSLSFVMCVGVAMAEGGRKARFFGQLEYWSTDDAYEQDEQMIDQYLASKAPFVNVSIKNSDIEAGMGARLGMLYPTNPSFLLGGSLGYIKGPEGDLGYYVTDGVGFEQASADLKTQFLRLMAEARFHAQISEKVAFRLGGGVGIAQGKIEQSWTYEESFGSEFQSEDASDTCWTGFTWEIMPSILFKAGESYVELGIAYARFPKSKENVDFNQFEWTPFGVHLGIEF